MIPGPHLIYQCPHCMGFFYAESVASGNTFHAEFYSDGKQINPDWPQAPKLTKCRECDAIIWLVKLKRITMCEPEDMDGKEWANAKEIQFLGVYDLYRALSEGFAQSSDETIFIRQQILWAFNDRVRSGRSLVLNAEEEGLWRQNCIELIAWLDQDDLGNKMLVVELNRNLGRFEEAIGILNTVPNEAFGSLKDKLMAACKAGQAEVLRLQ